MLDQLLHIGSGTLIVGNPADKSSTAFALLEDGNIVQDGKLLDSEYDSENLHIGSDVFTKSDSNWYGNYLGADNPKIKDNVYSYAKPPIDDLDFAAWKHDRSYDAVGASGIKGALFDVSTTIADYELAIQATQQTAGFSKKAIWAKGTATAFLLISIIKSNPVIFPRIITSTLMK